MTVHRVGYGAMQLAGPHVFGPPKDREGAVRVLRAAIEAGVNHIDTSDFYGPHVTNEIIREALYPYPKGLVIVTKVGAKRGEDGSWNPAQGVEELKEAVHDNLRRLKLERMDVVNLRLMGTGPGGGIPMEGSVEARWTALAEMREKGLIRELGLSNATPKQVEEAKAIAPVVCVQNLYNLAQRGEDGFLDALGKDGIAYVPFFPLGGFTPLQSGHLDEAAKELGVTAMQVALAWLLHRAPNVLLIPGTKSVGHLQENLKAAEIVIPAEILTKLDAIGAEK
jgi:aryl-alcohol dehydrogenase-like predicted oxidoreductase